VVGLTKDRRVSRILTFLFLLLGQSGFCQSLLIDETRDEKILYLHELDYLVDSTNAMTFSSILLASANGKFTRNDSYQNKDFNVDVSYWIRIPIHHIRETRKVWLLEFYDQTIDYIDAFVPATGGTYTHLKMGDHYPFTERTFQHKNFEVQLDVRSDTSLVYFFKVRSHEFAHYCPVQFPCVPGDP